MTSSWVFDERVHAGAEHFDPEHVNRFDEKLPFDPVDEVTLFQELGIAPTDTVVDMGAGTGTFSLAIADHCDRVVAVDISEMMLEVLRAKMDEEDTENIEIVNEGFLSYDHEAAPASFVFSKDALHHLPDFWKVEALKHMGNALEEGGLLRLRDFVFSFDPTDSTETITSWIETQRTETDFTKEEIDLHFREEFSTYGFVLEEMLEAVGFELIDITYETEFYAKYTCEWMNA